MNRSSFGRHAASGVAAVAMLGVAACVPPNERGGGESSSATVEGLSGTLNGAGASSQEAAQEAWRAGFQQANPEVTVNYDPVGSGGGREAFISGGVSFAGSDAYLDDEEGELSAATKRCNGEAPIEIPNYISPIAVIYNLEGVEDLRLSPETIAGIFAGEITSWDDEAIERDNPDADLPAERVTPVHRGDDSGTTENFTDYLSQTAPDTWTEEPSGLWPVKSGEAAQGTSGVVAAVRQGEGAVGYADASQAGALGVATVKVGQEYVGPTAEAASKVLEVSPRVEGRPESDMAFELDRATSESGAYPIVLTSYLIACQSYQDQQTADLVKGYLRYVVSDEGQRAAAETAGSAPLSDSLRDEASSIVEGISATG